MHNKESLKLTLNIIRELEIFYLKHGENVFIYTEFVLYKFDFFLILIFLCLLVCLCVAECVSIFIFVCVSISLCVHVCLDSFGCICLAFFCLCFSKTIKVIQHYYLPKIPAKGNYVFWAFFL